MDITPDKCLEIRAALPLYVGADLDPEEMESVGAHLARCASCDVLHQRALASRSALLEGLQATGDSGPSLWDGIRHRIGREVPQGPRRTESPLPTIASGPRMVSRGPLRSAFQRTGIGAAAAAAAVVLCLGLAFQGGLGDPGEVLPGGSDRVAPSSSLITGIGTGAIGAQPTSSGLTAGTQGVGSSSGLVPVEEGGKALYFDAVEIRADQGTFPVRVVPARPMPASSELVGSRLRPAGDR